MEASEVMHEVSDSISGRTCHIDPKKLSMFIGEVFSGKKGVFCSGKLEEAFRLDRMLTETVWSACRLSGLLMNQDIAAVLKHLQEEYRYCEPCAKVALKYCATPISKLAKDGPQE